MDELVPVEDFLAPLVRYLRGSELMQQCAQTIPEFGVNPLLGPPLVKLDPDAGGWVPNNSYGELWIFRNFQPNGAPYAHVEGSGTSAITLTSSSSFSRDIRGSGRIFPELSVHYHCDVSRDPESDIGSPVEYDGRDRCLTLHKRVKRLFDSDFVNHKGWLQIGGREDGTGFLRVASMTPGRALTIDEVPNGDGMVVGRATFELEIML